MNKKKNKRGICYDFENSGKDGRNEDDPRILALVRFIARRAAEEDYEELLRALPQENETTNGELKENETQ